MKREIKSLDSDFPYRLLDIRDSIKHKEYDDALEFIICLIREIYEKEQ